MTFHDSTVVILETARTVIRGGIGLHELLRPSSVEVPARVGLRRSALTGSTNGSTSRAPSQPPTASITVADYIVGTQLDDALAAGQDIVVFWPFAEGDIRDFTQAEALWKYVLFNQLQRRRVQNESPVLLTLFPGLARSTYERCSQIFFERFNVAGFSILERPMAQLYAANSLSGVVIDVGEDITDITPIYEGFIQHNARFSTRIGWKQCQFYLAHLLRSNQAVVNTLSPAENPLDPETLQKTLLDLAKFVWEEGHVKIPSSGEKAAVEDEGVTDIAAILVAGKEKAVIESGMKRKANAKASAAEQARAREIEAMDLITIEFRGHSLTLGKERHRFSEPLFEPRLMDLAGWIHDGSVSERPLALQEAVGHAVSRTEIDQRQYIWSGLFVTGEITRHIKGLGTALRSRLAPYIVSNPEMQTDVQTRNIRVLTLPEYYPEYRDTGEGFAAFLGASIIAKLTFSDSTGKNFVSKGDYSNYGPHAVIQMSPSLL